MGSTQGEMNWDDLKLFLAVARGGSISAGARQLGLQHSTVSRRMRRLEGRMGVRLFDKVAAGHVLTRAGAELAQAAERMEREVLAVDDSLGGRDREPAGPLRVTAIDNMASTILMPMFAAFSRAHPRVILHLMVSNSDLSLARREADVAIRLTNDPPETLIGKRVVTVASALYASRDYLQTLSREGGEPRWLGVDCCRFHRRWTREAAPDADPPMVVDDTLLTRAALREGLGVAILPCFMGDADPTLVRCAPPRADWALGLWILIHPDLRRTARVLAFRDFMSEAIRARAPMFAGSARETPPAQG